MGIRFTSTTKVFSLTTKTRSVTPGTRHQVPADFSEITKSKPEKNLTHGCNILLYLYNFLGIHSSIKEMDKFDS